MGWTTTLAPTTPTRNAFVKGTDPDAAGPGPPASLRDGLVPKKIARRYYTKNETQKNSPIQNKLRTNKKIRMDKQVLLTPYTLAGLQLNNRMVMAPMTRSRSNNEGDVANELMAEYYEQRATAGLIISEGIFVSDKAVGYINVPAIYTGQSGRMEEGNRSGTRQRRKDICPNVAHRPHVAPRLAERRPAAGAIGHQPTR